MGMLRYPPSKMANILDIDDEKAFFKELDDPESSLAKAYQKGIDKADYLIDSKLFDLAKTGDIKAIETLKDRQTRYEIQADDERSSRD